MRIDKFLSQLKYGSRNEIGQLIKKQHVKINDETVLKANLQINPNCDIIKVNDEIVYYKDEIILALNKPKGYLSANSDSKHQVLFDLIKEPFNRFELKIAGRLDLDSEGLMILTTNGQLVHQLTNPKKLIYKTYEVTLNQPFNQTARNELLTGVTIKDGYNEDYFAKAFSCEYSDQLAIIQISEGKFHQVKRMFLAVGFQVINLKRTQIANLKLGNLKLGEYREINRKEITDD